MTIQKKACAISKFKHRKQSDNLSYFSGNVNFEIMIMIAYKINVDSENPQSPVKYFQNYLENNHK